MKLPKFIRGQEVICVNDDFSLIHKTTTTFKYVTFPKQGDVYNVRDIFWVPEKNDFGITVAQIYNGPHNGKFEFNFSETRFESAKEIQNSQEALMAEVNKILEEDLIIA